MRSASLPPPQDLPDMMPMSPNVDLLLPGSGDNSGANAEFWNSLLGGSQPPQEQQQEQQQ